MSPGAMRRVFRNGGMQIADGSGVGLCEGREEFVAMQRSGEELPLAFESLLEKDGRFNGERAMESNANEH